MVQLKNVDKVTQKLDRDHIEYSIFSQITGEPTDLMIEKGVEQYKGGINFLTLMRWKSNRFYESHWGCNHKWTRN